jgi:hypothetical protein
MVRIKEEKDKDKTQGDGWREQPRKGGTWIEIADKGPIIATNHVRLPDFPAEVNDEDGDRRYHPYHAELAYQFALLGATDAFLGKVFGVSGVCIQKWRNRHPDFDRRFREGKEWADSNVSRMLYMRAIGYTIETEKFVTDGEGGFTRVQTFEHILPSVQAQSYWLNNRQPDRWRSSHTQINQGGAAPLAEVIPLDRVRSRLGSLRSRLITQE